MDKSKYQYEGLKWLFELELLNHPQVINQLKISILMCSKRIKEVELLIYRENRSMLVLLELSWIGRKFSKKWIFTEVQDALTQLLPSFRFRITDDSKIMEMAVEKVKKALTGGNSNESNLNPSVVVSQHASPVDNPKADAEKTVGNGPGVEPDNKESPVTPDEILPNASSGNSNE